MKPSFETELNQMTLSVVMTNFNDSQYLKVSIEAITRQLSLEDEFIIIDDCSTDDSATIIQGYVDKYEQITLIENKVNEGVVYGMNKGLKLSSKELLLYAASDDVIMPCLIEKAKKALAANRNGALFTAPALYKERDRGQCENWNSPNIGVTGFVNKYKAEKMMQKYGFTIIGGTTVYRRKMLIELGGFDERLGSITDTFTAQVLSLSGGFYWESEPMATIYLSQNSYGQNNRKDFTASLEIMKCVEGLMRGVYSQYFNDKYIGDWIKLWKFYSAYAEWKNCVKIPQDKYLQDTIKALGEDNRFMDKLNLLIIRLTIVTEHVTVLFYLYIKYGGIALLRRYFYVGRHRAWIKRLLLK